MRQYVLTLTDNNAPVPDENTDGVATSNMEYIRMKEEEEREASDLDEEYEEELEEGEEEGALTHNADEGTVNSPIKAPPCFAWPSKGLS